MGRRVAALLVDLLLTIAISYGVWFAFSGSAASALLLVPLLVTLIMDVIVQGRTGWTPGKRAMRLRCVEEATGEPPGRGRAMLRYALWLVDGLGGALVAFFSEGHRRLGDMAAGTVVVDVDALERWRAERAVPARQNGRGRNPYADDQWVGEAPPSAVDWGQGP